MPRVSTEIPYRDPLVRDLHWTLSSAPLLRCSNPEVRWPDTDWFLAISAHCAGQLDELESDPQPLRDIVETQTDRRLGNYFETLWRFWLKHNSRYRLLHANLPLRSRDRTIGEFDLLVEDSDTGKTLHWELAVKFYLGIGDTADSANWWGPAQRDRLDIKTRWLLEHQSRLSRHPQAGRLLHSLGIEIDETWVILKGRLFYPFAARAAPPRGVHPEHLRGFWTDPGTFAGFDEALWMPLARQQWLAPVSAVDHADCEDKHTLLSRWEQQPLQRPLCIARIVNGEEFERGFVVPDDWNHRIPRPTPGAAWIRPGRGDRYGCG